MGLAIVLDLSAVVVTVAGDSPKVLVVDRGGLDALPTGELDADGDRTLDRGLRRWVGEETGLELGYVEQLYTFGDLARDPAARQQGQRRLSIAYLAFVAHPAPLEPGASWRDLYAFFPWEDRRRAGETLAPAVLDALAAWGAGEERDERVDTTFGLDGAPWDPVRVLERYELLYEAALVPEAWRSGRDGSRLDLPTGRPAHLDHRRILASALGRLRGKLTYRPVVFELLPVTFTLSQLQRLVEALTGMRLHTQNFRRLVESGGLVEGTGETVRGTGGRPAELFRFRREVLRERPAPGVGLPGRR